MLNLQISDSLVETTPGLPIDLNFIGEAVSLTLAKLSAGEVDLSLVLTDDAQLSALNQQFLGVDAPTDVLSFPSDEIDVDSGQHYLGDILISYPRALAQAQAAGHTVQDELRLLAVHGALHLLGYDHDDQASKDRMWAQQAELLQALGSGILGPAGE